MGEVQIFQKFSRSLQKFKFSANIDATLGFQWLHGNRFYQTMKSSKTTQNKAKLPKLSETDPKWASDSWGPCVTQNDPEQPIKTQTRAKVNQNDPKRNQNMIQDGLKAKD